MEPPPHNSVIIGYIVLIGNTQDNTSCGRRLPSYIARVNKTIIGIDGGPELQKTVAKDCEIDGIQR